MSETLRACPFCGCHVELQKVGRDWYRINGYHYDNCFIEDMSPVYQQTEDGREQIIASWNGRAEKSA